MEGVGPPLADHGEGVIRYEDAGAILHRSCSGGTVIWVKDLGGDPPHGEDPGGVLTSGGRQLMG